MNKWLFIILGFTGLNSVSSLAMEPLKIPKRLLVISTHPDDSLMSAGLIQRVLQSGGAARVVDLTAGDYDSYFGIRFVKGQGYKKHSNEAVNYGYYRQLIEDRRGVQAIGLRESDLLFLGYPDGGMKNILDLGNKSPDQKFTSESTGFSEVPYEMAVSPGAPFTSKSVISDLSKVLIQFRPDAYVLSHPNDHHPDHASTYYFGMAALKASGLDQSKIQILQPLDAYGTDLQTGLDENRVFPIPPRLPSPTRWFEIQLTPDEMQKKKNLILSHQSQFADEYPHTSNPAKFGNHSYMLGYIAKNELFGVVDEVVVDEKFQERLGRSEFMKRLWGALGNVMRGLFE